MMYMQLTHFNTELCLECSESDLIKAAKGGDLDAFNSIVLKYQDALYRIAFGIVVDEELAQDCVQDALISAFQHLNSFYSGSLKSWLIRIVVNKCSDYLRSTHHRRSVSFHTLLSHVPNHEDDDFASSFEVRDGGLSVEAQLEKSELERAILASLSELTPQFRSIIVLADIEELDYKDIAVALDIPMGTVKSRLVRARLKLRSVLIKHRELLPSKFFDR